jgi:putative oxidoreductase
MAEQIPAVQQNRAVRAGAKIYSPLILVGGWLQPAVLLGVRLLWGAAFILAGWGKLQHLDRVGQFFANLHIPAPHAQAAFVACVEFFGGIFIALGLGTRLAAVFLAGAMIGAIHFSEHVSFFPPPKQTAAVVATGTDTAATTTEAKKEDDEVPPAIFDDPSAVIAVKPMSYLTVSLLLLAFGPGAVSLDALLKKCCGKQAPALDRPA